MPYNPNIHHRKSIRLKGYDYSQAGMYFITICVHNRACLYGNIKNGEMLLNDAGQMVENEWLKLLHRFPNIQLHEYVVMPNHFHAIMEMVGSTLVVDPNDEMVAHNMGQHEKGQPQGIAPTKTKTVGDVVGAFQSIVTVEYIRGVKQLGWEQFNGKLWQRNYWEHIIRNEQSYQRISEYIINNPKNWDVDKLNRK
jgi:putative transposase